MTIGKKRGNSGKTIVNGDNQKGSLDKAINHQRTHRVSDTAPPPPRKPPSSGGSDDKDRK